MPLATDIAPVPTGDPEVRAGTARALALNAAGTAVLCAFLGVWVLTWGNAIGGIALMLSAVPAVVLLGVGAYRTNRARFDLDAAGAMVDLAWSTERYPLDQIERFDIERECTRAFPVLVERDGFRRGIPALGRSKSAAAAVEADVDALNRRLDALRSA
jgi:hypothetical protein